MTQAMLSEDHTGEGPHDEAPPDDGGPGAGEVGTRFAEFERLAAARARGEVVWMPRDMTGNDRRLHVRQTLREDHSERIVGRAEDAPEKFSKLADSLYSFFRGTCLLFYRDMAGEDSWMPTVLTLGDVHPENFGVMPSADNAPMFGVNDFDEAYYAPFTWDLKRGATGFMLAAADQGIGKKRRRKIVEHFVKGYIEGIESFARYENELDHQVRLDNAPKLVRKLIEDALESRDAWLADGYHEEYRRGFRASKKLVPISSRVDEFQELVDRWVRDCGIDVPKRAGEMKVKDVAIRRSQGTASLGLDRYYILIEGQHADATDDIVLEFKRARHSALAGLVPPSDLGAYSEGERIAHAQGVQLVRADVFYGSVEFEGKSFMTRERAPYRDSIDVDDLSKKSWKKYARICGRSLAQAHALSDEVGDVDHEIETEILEAIGPRKLFVDDMVRFATEACERIAHDHEFFKEDHALGAFETIDIVFR